MSQGTISEYVEVSDATGNELTVLRTKVEYEDLCGSLFDPWFPPLVGGEPVPTRANKRKQLT